MTDTTKQASNMFDAMREAIEATPTEERVEAWKREAEFQERLKAQRIEDLRARSNWPAKHSGTAVKHSGSAWDEMLYSLVDKAGTGFIAALVGGRGNGKTQMAVELIRHVTGNEKSARFATAMEFFMSIKSTYKRDCEKTEADVIKEFRRPALLVLDEIGRRGETDWENNLLFELLNGRYNDKKDTLLLCNLSAAELQASLGPSLISRLNESGGLIQCNWPSFRG